MKPICKVAGAVIIISLMFIADIPYLSKKLVPEAQAFRGRGAAFVVGYAVGSRHSAPAAAAAPAPAPVIINVPPAAPAPDAASQQQSATAQQQSVTAQQQSVTAQQQSATAQQQSATAQQQAAASGKSLPLGTVVSALPPGCTPSTVGGVNYYYCGGTFYQAMYQGSTLVYVTTQPK
jgi:hypothetical protein